jgi:hypothetical protein
MDQQRVSAGGNRKDCKRFWGASPSQQANVWLTVLT